MLPREELWHTYQAYYKKYGVMKKDLADVQKKQISCTDQLQQACAELSKKRDSELRAMQEEGRKNDSLQQALQSEGIHGTIAQKYNESLYQEVTENQKQIADVEHRRQESEQALLARQQERRQEIQQQRAEYRKKLASLRENQNFFRTSFDEESFRQERESYNNQQLADFRAQKNQEKKQLEEQVDEELRRLDLLQNQYLQAGKELDVQRELLQKKQQAGQMPGSFLKALEEPVEHFVARNNLHTGQQVLDMAKEVDGVAMTEKKGVASPLLAKILGVGLPALVGILLFVILQFGGIHFLFMKSAITGLCNFLLYTAFALSFCAIGYGLLTKYVGIGAGVLGALGGAAAGFYVGSFWKVHISLNTVAKAETGLKFLMSLALLLVLLTISAKTRLGTKLAGWLAGMILQCHAKKELAKNLCEQSDLYYAVLQYEKIIRTVVRQNRDEKTRTLQRSLDQLELERDTQADILKERLQEETEASANEERQKVVRNRVLQEKKQQENTDLENEYLTALRVCDEQEKELQEKDKRELEALHNQYDLQLAESRQKQDTLQRTVQQEYDKLNVLLTKRKAQNDQKQEDIIQQYRELKIQTEQKWKEKERNLKKKAEEIQNKLQQLREKMQDIRTQSVKPVPFDESRGVLADSLYLIFESNNQEPDLVTEIRHEKHPLVFLYDPSAEEANKNFVEEFADIVLSGLYVVNPIRLIRATVLDPYSRGRRFAMRASQKLLEVENNPRNLLSSVQESMLQIAGTGTTIDEYNQSKYDKDQEERVCLPYRIVEFVVPEADAQKGTFLDESFWGMMEDGVKNGFIPIFYIDVRDWNSAGETEKGYNGDFILQLKKAVIKNKGHVYQVDLPRQKVEEVFLSPAR